MDDLSLLLIYLPLPNSVAVIGLCGYMNEFLGIARKWDNQSINPIINPGADLEIYGGGSSYSPFLEDLEWEVEENIYE